MKTSDVKEKVKQQLTTNRFEHTLRVSEEAVKLAKTYHVSEHKAELAALLHDYAKNLSPQVLKTMIIQYDLSHDLLDFNQELWHGPVGAILIEQELGIHDHEILSAVRYHTTGKAAMSPLELVIFVADYIEPGRRFPGLSEVQEMAYQDLHQAAWMVSKNTIEYLMRKKAQIYPDSFYAYNDLTRKVFLSSK